MNVLECDDCEARFSEEINRSHRYIKDRAIKDKCGRVDHRSVCVDCVGNYAEDEQNEGLYVRKTQ